MFYIYVSILQIKPDKRLFNEIDEIETGLESFTEQNFYTTSFENIIEEGDRRHRKKGIRKIR